jgi:MFS family permease
LNIFSSFSPVLRRNLAILFGAGLCFWAGLAGLLPSLPLYVEYFGANGQQIGFVIASFAIGLLGARPAMARLTDRRGRKPALVIGMVAIAIAPLGYLLVQFLPSFTLALTLLGQPISIHSPIVLLMLVRAGHGISIAAFVTGYSALVADLAPPHQRGELISYMSLVNPIGMALGPALGGYLQAWSGFSLVFVSMAALGTIGLLCATAVKEPHRDASQATRAASNLSQKPFWSLLFTPPVRIPALVLLLVGLAFGSLVAFIPLYARENQLSLNVGLIYTSSALASFVVRIIAGPASDRYGRGRFISMGLILYALAMSLLWQAHSEVWVLLAGTVQGLGGGILIPMIATLMADRSHPEERGLMFGLCLTGFDVGIAMAGPLMGWFADLTSYRDIFGLASLMSVLGLLIFITTSSKDLHHSLRFSLSHGKDVYAVEQS